MPAAAGASDSAQMLRHLIVRQSALLSMLIGRERRTEAGGTVRRAHGTTHREDRAGLLVGEEPARHSDGLRLYGHLGWLTSREGAPAERIEAEATWSTEGHRLHEVARTSGTGPRPHRSLPRMNYIGAIAESVFLACSALAFSWVGSSFTSQKGNLPQRPACIGESSIDRVLRLPRYVGSPCREAQHHFPITP